MSFCLQLLNTMDRHKFPISASYTRVDTKSFLMLPNTKDRIQLPISIEKKQYKTPWDAGRRKKFPVKKFFFKRGGKRDLNISMIKQNIHNYLPFFFFFKQTWQIQVLWFFVHIKKHTHTCTIQCNHLHQSGIHTSQGREKATPPKKKQQHVFSNCCPN